MLPPNAGRLLAYLDAIAEAGGEAGRMDLLRVAGSEANLNRMVGKLVEFRLVEEKLDGDRKRYKKTELGELWHKALRSHEYVGSLIEELGRSRFQSN